MIVNSLYNSKQVLVKYIGYLFSWLVTSRFDRSSNRFPGRFNPNDQANSQIQRRGGETCDRVRIRREGGRALNEKNREGSARFFFIAGDERGGDKRSVAQESVRTKRPFTRLVIMFTGRWIGCGRVIYTLSFPLLSPTSLFPLAVQ